MVIILSLNFPPKKVIKIFAFVGSSSTSLIQCCTSFSLSSSSNSSEFDRYLGTYRMHKPPSSLSYRVEDSDSVHLDHPLVVAKGGKTFGASWTKESGGNGEAVVRFEGKVMWLVGKQWLDTLCCNLDFHSS